MCVCVSVISDDILNYAVALSDALEHGVSESVPH
jgi:hypothetical protein